MDSPLASILLSTSTSPLIHSHMLSPSPTTPGAPISPSTTLDVSAPIKPFVCLFPSCNKAFTRKSDLKRHKRIHSNDRPFVCEHCDKGFIQRSALVVHMRTHTGERPHRCMFENCDKAFADSSSLARHRRAHQQQRPHVCPVSACLKTFSRRSAMLKHIAVHHPDTNTHALLTNTATCPPQTDQCDSDDEDFSNSQHALFSRSTSSDTDSARTISMSPSFTTSTINTPFDSRHATPEPSSASWPSSSGASFLLDPYVGAPAATTYEVPIVTTPWTVSSPIGMVVLSDQQPRFDVGKMYIPPYAYDVSGRCACGAPGCLAGQTAGLTYVPMQTDPQPQPSQSMQPMLVDPRGYAAYFAPSPLQRL